MTVLAFGLAAILASLAALHLAWAVGWWVPIRDEAALTRAVVGARGQTRMPGPVPCALVAVVLGLVASLPFTPGFPGQKLLILLAACVFCLRGVMAYIPVWRRLLPEAPFATLDRQLYGPLCLFIGGGLALMTLTGD